MIRVVKGENQGNSLQLWEEFIPKFEVSIVKVMLEPEVKIRQLRELKGFSQEYMANELGISTKAYSNLENGHTQVSISRLEQICQILEVNPLKLLGFDESVLFDQCQFDNNSPGISHFYASAKERELYEKLLLQSEGRVKALENEVEYLRTQLEKLLKS
ncbi:MAG: helix-turn-helix transcriptional regulator [Salibacteraceae bacterium]